MIRNRLKEIMSIKNISANKIHSETGISKSTISKISNNNTNMIEMNTIDKLCFYLEIEPKDLFEYYPVRIEIANSIVLEARDNYIIHTVVNIDEKIIEYEMRFLGTTTIKDPFNVNVGMYFVSMFLDPDYEENNTSLKYLNEYPLGIIEKIRIMLIEKIREDFKPFSDEIGADYNFIYKK